MTKTNIINRRKFLEIIGGCSCGLMITSCTTAPITDRKQLKLIPEHTINAQAAQLYERVKNKTKLITNSSDLKLIKDIGSKIEQSVSEYFKSVNQIIPSLEALNELANEHNIQTIITYPNNDAGGNKIILKLKEFSTYCNSNIKIIPHLGHKKYHSLLRLCGQIGLGVCVGNSSSGIIEVPSFKIGTVNIGNRQKGRVRSGSVIDSELKVDTIKAAILSLFDENIRQISQEGLNPYDAGETSKNIVNKINELNKDQIKIKSFYDLSDQEL